MSDESQNPPLPPGRDDLLISPQLYLGQNVYVVKDPVSLSYFRLTPVEHFVFQSLDGRRTAEELAEEASRVFPDERVDAQEVQRFVQMLQQAGLLLGRGETHGWWLRELARRRGRRRRTGQAMNFLFLRIPLIDPDRMLDRLYSVVRPVMNATLMWPALAGMAICAVAVLWEIHRVGNLAYPVLGATNLLLLSGVFVVVKVIHEVGHGLAAKHRGLEVHEIGVLLIVFWPLFYVETSDAWMVPRRRDRLWINAGGVFIEFLFASGAACVWLLTEPGVVNQIAFNIMLTASVTTVLFNANPLLRYDGYYMLMDYLEIPNLKPKSTQYLGYLAKRYLMGMGDTEPPAEADRKPVFMPFYAVASSVYRWLVIFGIIGMVWVVLDPYGLESVGALLAGVAVVTMVILPMFRMLRFVWSQRAHTWRRLLVSGAGGVALLGVAAAIGAIPMRQTIEQPGVLLANQRQPLFVSVDGRVAELLMEPGERVKKGQPILRLENPELRNGLAEKRIEKKLAKVGLQKAREEGKAAKVEAARSRLTLLRKKIRYLEDKVERLTVRAPIGGRLQPKKRLEAMVGQYVKKGQKLGTMIGQAVPKFVVVLPESDAARVRERMAREKAEAPSVRCRLWSMPGKTWKGHLDEIGAELAQKLPHDALASVYGGEVDSKMKGRYNPVPSERSVLARVELRKGEDLASYLLRDGMSGRGKIILGESRLAAQQWRAVRKALSLDWWL